MKDVTRLYLSRHGENRANLEGVLSHRVVDHPLTDRGRRQAAALAEWLAQRGTSAVYSSPLKRAMETASVVSERVGAPVFTREGLREVNVGSLDPDGSLRSAVLAVRDDHQDRPVAFIERLAEAGIAKLHQHLDSGKPLRELLALYEPPAG